MVFTWWTWQDLNPPHSFCSFVHHHSGLEMQQLTLLMGLTYITLDIMFVLNTWMKINNWATNSWTSPNTSLFTSSRASACVLEPVLPSINASILNMSNISLLIGYLPQAFSGARACLCVQMTSKDDVAASSRHHERKARLQTTVHTTFLNCVNAPRSNKATINNWRHPVSCVLSSR